MALIPPCPPCFAPVRCTRQTLQGRVCSWCVHRLAQMQQPAYTMRVDEVHTDLAFAACWREVLVDDGASGLRESPVSSAVALAEGLRSFTGAILPGLRPFTWQSSMSAARYGSEITVYRCQAEQLC